jgi:hypothetical protein
MHKLVSCAVLVLVAAVNAHAAGRTHPCGDDAGIRAKALLETHINFPDKDFKPEEYSVAQAYKVLAPIKNPMNTRQKFDVLELIGSVYKTQYRIRMIYVLDADICVLVGQEILELTTL